MPRIKASPKKCIKTTHSNSQQSSNTWVFLVKGDALDVPEGYAGTGTPDVVQLRHPQTGQPAMFLFSPGDGMVQEVLTFSENRRSWFIEETVKSDGKMHLSTPIDPIFLVLPYLRKAGQAVPLDQLLTDEEFPETERLLRSAGLKHLAQVADRKGDEELNAYKYNEEKTLSWLQRKAERVAEVLKQKGVHVSGGAVSASFVKSGKQDVDAELYLKYAHGIVSDYLMEDLSAKLARQLGFPEEAPRDGKRKLGATAASPPPPLPVPVSVPSTAPEPKKPRADDVSNGGVLDLTKPEKAVKPVSSKEKARAKSASGSKHLSSYFKKK
ncbi:ribonuclease H2 subunit B [Bacillus rossius redtenbacheri]|uniref:ribonuclease H2 subunit B n=1 Tax=Bacillus rossius redtenbacheri TaxID=93214 RepID=UPI002FDC9319